MPSIIREAESSRDAGQHSIDGWNPMKLTSLRILTAIVALAAAVTAVAAERVDQTTVTAVVTKFKALRPDLKVVNAEPATVPGMVLIELVGGTQLYATADGRYLISGDLYEMGEKLVNVGEQARDARRRELIAGVPLSDMVVFPATTERRAVLTVFTDVDCGYCRKFHKEVPTLNKMGVEVRYLAYPRAGIGSASYNKLVTAWCSKDREDAITRMKRGEELPPKTCDNPVAREYELGHLAGLQGTPAIVLEDGQMLPGYMPARELGQLLGIPAASG
jgi:thiol:disulfide interchange protein DsbC